MLKAWKTLERTGMAETRIFNIEKIRCRQEARGLEVDFIVLDTPEWVNVVALTPSGRVVLIRQFRAGSGEIAIEIPGGACEPGEAPIDAARRELLEETGYTAERFTVIGQVKPNPAFMNNRCFTVLAEAARPTGHAHPDVDEEIETEEVTVEEFSRLIRKGDIDHALVWAAYLHMIFLLERDRKTAGVV